VETIRQTLFTGWNFMRWLRLAFGVIFMVQAIQMHDALIGLIAGFFLITAISNIGCCGAGRCAAPRQQAMKDEIEEITFEEIKNK